MTKKRTIDGSQRRLSLGQFDNAETIKQVLQKKETSQEIKRIFDVFSERVGFDSNPSQTELSASVSYYADYQELVALSILTIILAQERNKKITLINNEVIVSYKLINSQFSNLENGLAKRSRQDAGLPNRSLERAKRTVTTNPISQKLGEIACELGLKLYKGIENHLVMMRDASRVSGVYGGDYTRVRSLLETKEKEIRGIMIHDSDLPIPDALPENSQKEIQKERQLLKAPDLPLPGDVIRNYRFPWDLKITSFDEDKDIAFAEGVDEEKKIRTYKIPLNRLERISQNCWNFYGARPQR